MEVKEEQELFITTTCMTRFNYRYPRVAKLLYGDKKVKVKRQLFSQQSD